MASVMMKVAAKTSMRGNPVRPVKKEEDGRIPRISRLLALALIIDEKVRKREIKDYTALAQMGGITTARATQIMSLCLLAPDIQEEILFLPKYVGRDPWKEKGILRMCGETDWKRQRRMWREEKRKAA